MPDQTPALDDFRRAYETNHKEWWLLDCGHHMNLFDEALDRIDEASDWAAWFAAERDHVAHQRNEELAANRRYIDRMAEQLDAKDARIAELEAAQSDPAGYVVVTRNSEGGLHRSATAWDDLERATAAGDFQARHAEGTGCSATVHELGREVSE